MDKWAISACETAIRTMSVTEEYRLVTCQEARANEVKLQRAWRCMETGEIEWRNVPTILLTNEEYDRGSRGSK